MGSGGLGTGSGDISAGVPSGGVHGGGPPAVTPGTGSSSGCRATCQGHGAYACGTSDRLRREERGETRQQQSRHPLSLKICFRPHGSRVCSALAIMRPHMPWVQPQTACAGQILQHQCVHLSACLRTNATPSRMHIVQLVQQDAILPLPLSRVSATPWPPPPAS